MVLGFLTSVAKMANVFNVRGAHALYGSNVCILMRAYGT